MSLQSALLSVIAFLVGALLAAQAPINVLAGGKLGHPLMAALLSFATGTIVLAVIAVLVARDELVSANLWSLPPWMWLGGFFGAAYITGSIILTPIIGIGAFLAFAIAGQATASLMLDHYGAFGLAVREITMGRAVGATLVIVGAVMVRIY
jgi:transporter family-2 protein